jgi:hypothetical protein
VDDPDVDVLSELAAAVTALDVRFRRASVDEQEDLGPERDALFAAYASARQKLLQAGIRCTPDDVEQMRTLKLRMDRAADLQTLLQASASIVRLTTRIVV